MANQHFFLRLIPPRPTFVLDMTDAEKRAMGEHAAYMKSLFDAGKILIYGPVMSMPPFGLGVFEVADETEVRRIMDKDPTVVAGINRYEIAPMRIGAARALN
jgi:uncharacterized protein YciI